MSNNSEQDQVRLIAERIARRVAHNSAEEKTVNNNGAAESFVEVAALRAGLRELQQRLTQIEARITPDESRSVYQTKDAGSNVQTNVPKENSPPQSVTSAASQTRSQWLSGVYVPATHPSAERFEIDEASAVSELVDFFENAKMCELEPGGKPCDHCAMCSSRGF